MAVDDLDRLGLIATRDVRSWDASVLLVCTKLYLGQERVHLVALCFFCDLQINLVAKLFTASAASDARNYQSYEKQEWNDYYHCESEVCSSGVAAMFVTICIVGRVTTVVVAVTDTSIGTADVRGALSSVDVRITIDNVPRAFKAVKHF